jgi:G:T/U-mismatch repair DNA glycosylase
MNNIMSDYHPYDPFIPKKIKKLIIGTIPPHRFCKNAHNQFLCKINDDDVRFYYGSRDNYFWNLMASISKQTFIKKNNKASIMQRKLFLEKKEIGITDIIKSCNRKNNSSSDNKLFKIDYKKIDLLNILKNYPNIDTLIYTSEFVKKCIYNIFKIYHKNKGKKNYNIEINNKIYNVIILYSPSPQALRGIGSNGEEIRLMQYKEIFG